jgi:hypothetical protein
MCRNLDPHLRAVNCSSCPEAMSIARAYVKGAIEFEVADFSGGKLCLENRECSGESFSSSFPQ